MQGVFDLTKYDAGGFKDADFQRSLKDGTLHELLASLEVKQRCKAISNKLFDTCAEIWLFRLFSGPSPSAPASSMTSTSAIFANIALLTTTGETSSYTESTNESANPHNVTESANTTSAGKRFEEDEILAFKVQTDPGALGREAIKFTDTFLYLPSEGGSTDIRSIGIYCATTGDSTGSVTRGRVGRVRLKDAQGNNLILHKGSNEVLLVEYSFTLVSN